MAETTSETTAETTASTAEVDESHLSYEAARDRLLETVRALEAGGTTLEQSLALWEAGERLARICQEHLDGARRRLDAVIDAKADGATDADAG